MPTLPIHRTHAKAATERAVTAARRLAQLVAAAERAKTLSASDETTLAQALTGAESTAEDIAHAAEARLTSLAATLGTLGVLAPAMRGLGVGAG